MKLVDHDQRRRELAQAVWQVIERSGIRGATVRAVAQQAGVSPGSLRHYFSDQGGLLRFAAERMTEQVASRLHAHLGSEAPAHEVATALLLECLPVDQDRRIECAVWLEGLMQSRHDKALARMREQGFAGARHMCRVAWALRAGVGLPEQGEPLEAHHERMAGHLHAFLDGLTLQATVAGEEFSPHRLRAEVETMLRSLEAAAVPLGEVR